MYIKGDLYFLEPNLIWLVYTDSVNLQTYITIDCTRLSKNTAN